MAVGDTTTPDASKKETAYLFRTGDLVSDGEAIIRGPDEATRSLKTGSRVNRLLGRADHLD